MWLWQFKKFLGENMSRTEQVKLNEFDKRIEYFARVRALIMKIVNSQPGLTVEEISKEFMVRHGFLPRIENRLRESRKLGYVVSVKEADNRLHWYSKTVGGV
jgi:hypothetical protein